MQESFASLWLPSWLEASGKRLLVIDARQVGSFCLCFDDLAIGYRILGTRLESARESRLSIDKQVPDGLQSSTLGTFRGTFKGGQRGYLPAT